MPSQVIRNWSTAHDLAKKARDKEYGYVIDSSTRVRVSRDKHGYRGHELTKPDAAVYAIVHFSTEVVYFYPDGAIGINLHGWDTITTKRRVHTHTPFRVYSHRGASWLYAAGQRIPMDTSEEIVIKGKTVTDPSGVVIEKTVKAALPRPLPKGRNPVVKPLVGDLLRAPDGTNWLVAREPHHGGLKLYGYRGDFPAYRAYAAVNGQTIDLNPLFLLTTDGWTAVQRFDLKKEVSDVA
jgi:hypothetical protein